MDILLFLVMGMLGAAAMFAGDMLLYYDKNDFVSDGTMQPVIELMQDVSKGRLYVGSILGPVAAFLYCVGYYHCALMMERYRALGVVCFLVNCLGIILGGAYHSHWVYYGRVKNADAMKEVLDFTVLLNRVTYGVIAVGFLLLLLFIALGFTVFPRWLAVFSPGVLFLMTSLVKKLPKGRAHMIVVGGWSNLISVIYYAAAIITLLAR